MALFTGTRERVSRTTVRVSRAPGGGRVRVFTTAAGPPECPVIRPILLSSDDRVARVSLLPEGALLLAGDHIAIDIAVDGGTHLELVEPTGTVAYGMDGGQARWDIDIKLADDARLSWAAEPFVVAQGAMVHRTTRVELAEDARCALREVLVFGRQNERPGTLVQRFEVKRGTELLMESLKVDADSSQLLLGSGCRVLSQVAMLGSRLDPAAVEAERAGHVHRFELEGDGTLVRALAADAHCAALPHTWAAARLQLMGGSKARST